MQDGGAPDQHMQTEAVLKPVVPVGGGAPLPRPKPAKPGILRRIFSPQIKAAPPASMRRRRAVYTLAAIGFAGYFAAAGVIGAFGWAAKDMPQTKALWAAEKAPEITILDRHGREILRTGGAETKPVSLSDIPPDLTAALIAIEDKRFVHHAGFDVIGLARALHVNWKAGRVVQGGSTLTQQLAKNVFLSQNQTLKRKAQEVMLAVWIEHRMSKSEILESYLSRVYFGGGTLGIESGSKRFFNKPANQLSTGEAALLAGILQAPDRLNPLKNRAGSAERTAKVLRQMHMQGYLTQAAYHQAMHDPILVEPLPVQTHPSTAYFTDWILSQTDALTGPPKSDIAIHTTLDLDAQIAAERAINAELSTDKNAQQAAIMAFDGTGGIRVMVGGADYRHSPYNRAISAKRQPGSAFKPFVYLAALEAGYSPWDSYVDAPIDIDGWQPGNFNNQFKGEMSLQDALAQSVNTIAVQINEDIGRSRAVSVAKRLGMPAFQPYASLALGAQETSLFDLTRAYIPFANWGYDAEPYGLAAIYTVGGQTLYSHEASTQGRVIDPQTLGLINLMLRHVVDAGTGRAARIPGRDIAGKTGTTNDYRDAWFIGYTSDYIAGVWVGNDDNSKMSRATGGTIPARIWQGFMANALMDHPINTLPTAEAPVIPQNEARLETLLSQLESSLPLPQPDEESAESAPTITPPAIGPN